MQNNYTKQAEEVLKTARALARQMGHLYVGTEHLLVALRKVYKGVAGQVLAHNGLKEDEVLKVLNELVSPVGKMSQKENHRRVRDCHIFWKAVKHRQCV